MIAVARRDGLITIGLILLCTWASAAKANEQNVQHTPQFDLMHLWLADIEAPALHYIKEVVEGAGVKWFDHPVSGNFYGVRAAFANRMSLGAPPDAVFWIGGDEITSMVDTGIIRPIDNQSISENLIGFLKPEIAQRVSYKQALTALPVVIHLQNIAVINRRIFQRLNLDLPNSWAEFVAQLPLIKQAGYTPIAMSDQRWQMRFLFASIMSDGLSSAEFRDLLLGQRDASWSEAQFERAFGVLKALKPYSNTDYDDLVWEKVVQKVLDGEAAMTIMGDFAAPGLLRNDDVVCTLAPGGKFVNWSFDVLAFTKLPETASHEGQDRAIRALAHRDVLRNFALKKGGIPVVTGVSPEQADACSANSMKAWNDLEKFQFNVESWRLHLNSLSSIAHAFWQADDPKPAEYSAQLGKELKSIELE